MKSQSPSSISTLIGQSKVYAKCREMWGLDLRSIALFRVTLGIVCFGDLLLKYGDVEAFYTDYGIISRKTMLENFAPWYDFSFHMWNGGLLFQQFLFFIHALLCFGFILGWHTTLCNIGLYFFTRSIQDRLLIVLHSGDDVHRILLFWSIFLPMGACYSLDSGFSTYMTNSSEERKKTKKTFVLSSTTFALLSQMGMLYFISVFHKTGADWRTDFNATYYALHMDYYRTWIGDLFLSVPAIVPKALTFGVFWYEAIGPFLLLFPIWKTPYVRTFALFGFIMLHVGLGSCMRLGQFIYICICVELAFLPPLWWDKLAVYLRTKERQQLRVYYNQPNKNISFSRFLAVFFKTFFLIPETQILELNHIDTVGVHTDITDIEQGKKPNPYVWLAAEVGANGVKEKNIEALELLFRMSPVLWPLAFIAQLCSGCINIAFNFFQRITTTDATSSFFGIYVLPTAERPKTRTMRMRKKLFKLACNIFVGVLAIEMLSWNLESAHLYKNPPWVVEHLHIVGLEQVWRMFSPTPPHHHFWHVIEATLEDGSVVELLKDGALWTWTPNEPFTFDPPKSQYYTYNSHPWYKFWENFNWSEDPEPLRLGFGRWICREYNKRHGGTPKQLKTFNIWILWERINLDYTRSPGEKEVLWQHIC
eukprot:TRINITY_DN1914_c0_g1_i1.p1 TRINITY_DN1914_c0_g1~~TRINITY_DN1914_c0_g1_i1.p1  ORF type:complete len:648 (-),score=135.27 TRINITY_DN1914_c0_g1_i1:109-2052(-)